MAQMGGARLTAGLSPPRLWSGVERGRWLERWLIGVYGDLSAQARCSDGMKDVPAPDE